MSTISAAPAISNLILENQKGFKVFFDAKYLSLERAGLVAIQYNDKQEYNNSIVYYIDPERPTKLLNAESALKLFLSKEGHDRLVEAVARAKGNTVDTTLINVIPTIGERQAGEKEMIRSIKLEEEEKKETDNNGTKVS